MAPLNRLVVWVALAALPASAQTMYRWTDASGTVHYTDDASTAPKGVRVQTTEGAELNSIEVSKDTDTGPEDEAQPEAEPAPAQRSGPDEKTWRAAYTAAREKIRWLAVEIADEEKRATPIAHGCTVAHPRSRGPVPAEQYVCEYVQGGGYARDQEQLSDDRLKLAAAREELVALDRKATFAGVPFAWRR